MLQSLTRHIDEARHTLLLALRRHGQTFSAAGAMAILCAELGLWADAARLGGASLASEGPTTLWRDPRFSHETAQWQASLAAASCPAADIERCLTEDQRLDEAAIPAIGQRVAALVQHT